MGRLLPVVEPRSLAFQCGEWSLPIVPSAADIWATQDTLSVLQEARALGAEIDAFLLFNQVRAGTLLAEQSRDAMESVTTEVTVTLLPITIGIRESFRQSFMAGKGVVEFEPGGKAAIEIMELYTTIVKQLVEEKKIND